MQDLKDDVLGGYDEAELIELSEADTYGGTGPWCIATVTLVTAAICPTTKCTSQC
ncbi:class II lanthipeptide, LchA2/BrtA2 family [Plantactinospora siamensis]|uniref:Class II lanthipeptide, LchA2/BrtA2 family n=1 Tax=Plantactinospora siamensis TaxID=555372 RepID=A0ABV6NS21_9ACTN